MLSILFIIVYLIFCLRSKSETILCSLIFLLPFHVFIKQSAIFYIGDVGLVPMWRELGILMYATKVFLKDKHHKLNVFAVIMSVIFVLMLLIYFYIGRSNENAFTTLRIYLSVIVLLISVSVAKFTSESLKNIQKWVIITICINGIVGIFQYFMFPLEIGIFMGGGIVETDTGYYLRGSYQQSGVMRMSGIVGNPNAFGCFLSFSLSWLLLSFKQYYNKINKVFYIFLFLLGFFCILMTFSRVAWLLLAFIFFILGLGGGNITSKFKYLIFGVFVLFIVLFAIYIVFPTAFTLFEKTFTMKEESIASRNDMLNESFMFFVNNIAGNGLGFSDAETGIVHSESSILNFGLNCGIGGVVFLILYIVGRLKTIWKNRKYHLVYSLCIATIIIATVVAWLSVSVLAWPFIYYLFFTMGLGINPSFKKIKTLNKVTYE